MAPKIEGFTEADFRRLQSIAVMPKGRTHATRDITDEYRDPKTGERIKLVLDQLGNVRRFRAHGMDVNIRR